MTNPKEFHLLTEGTHFYNVQELTKIRHDNRHVKEVQEECVLDRSVIVRDISLSVSGQAEDDVFLGDPLLWINIRRGNTLLEFYDPSNFTKL